MKWYFTVITLFCSSFSGSFAQGQDSRLDLVVNGEGFHSNIPSQRSIFHYKFHESQGADVACRSYSNGNATVRLLFQSPPGESKELISQGSVNLYLKLSAAHNTSTMTCARVGSSFPEVELILELVTGNQGLISFDVNGLIPPSTGSKNVLHKYYYHYHEGEHISMKIINDNATFDLQNCDIYLDPPVEVQNYLQVTGVNEHYANIPPFTLQSNNNGTYMTCNRRKTHTSEYYQTTITFIIRDDDDVNAVAPNLSMSNILYQSRNFSGNVIQYQLGQDTLSLSCGCDTDHPNQYHDFCKTNAASIYVQYRLQFHVQHSNIKCQENNESIIYFEFIGSVPFPTTTKRPTSKSTTAKPTTTKRPTAKPTTAKRITSKSTTAKPTTTKPTTTKRPTAKPTTAKRTTSESTTAKPTTTKRPTAKPTTAKQKQPDKPSYTVVPLSPSSQTNPVHVNPTTLPTRASEPDVKSTAVAAVNLTSIETDDKETSAEQKNSSKKDDGAIKWAIACTVVVILVLAAVTTWFVFKYFRTQRLLKQESSVVEYQNLPEHHEHSMTSQSPWYSVDDVTYAHTVHQNLYSTPAHNHDGETQEPTYTVPRDSLNQIYSNQALQNQTYQNTGYQNNYSTLLPVQEIGSIYSAVQNNMPSYAMVQNQLTNVLLKHTNRYATPNDLEADGKINSHYQNSSAQSSNQTTEANYANVIQNLKNMKNVSEYSEKERDYL